MDFVRGLMKNLAQPIKTKTKRPKFIASCLFINKAKSAIAWVHLEELVGILVKIFPQDSLLDNKVRTQRTPHSDPVSQQVWHDRDISR